MAKELSDFFKIIAQEKRQKTEEVEKDKKILKEFENFLYSDKPKKKSTAKKVSPPETPDDFGNLSNISPPPLKEETLIEKSLGLLSEPSNTKQKTDPITPINQSFATHEDLQRHYKLFLERIQQQLSTLGGGGETRFEFLDDVNRNSVRRDGYYLKFDETTGKFLGSAILDDDYTTQIEEQGDDNVISVINVPNTDLGPIQSLLFDPTHIDTNDDPGLLNWNIEDRTLNLHHPDGVTQQIGQETYFLVKNETGSTIPNGSVVRFAGATNRDGAARLLVAPLLADGTFPSLYTVGVLTQDIENDEEGFATVFGKIRQLNTTGTLVGETWNVGDILYVNPNISGGLTNVKPTAPDNVIPVAAVIKVGATNGEIFVRPTIEQKYSYGRFARTTDITFLSADTAYPIIFNETQISNGVGLGTTSSQMVVDQSGFYKINTSVQLDTTGTKGTCYLWIRKNGVDVNGTTRRTHTSASEDIKTFNYFIDISLNGGDFIEICTAVSANTLRFSSFPATAFAPSTAGVLVSVTQEIL